MGESIVPQFSHGVLTIEFSRWITDSVHRYSSRLLTGPGVLVNIKLARGCAPKDQWEFQEIGLIYGRYLQFRFLKWLLKRMENNK